MADSTLSCAYLKQAEAEVRYRPMIYINFNLEHSILLMPQTDAVRDKPPHTVKTYPCRVRPVGSM